MLSDLMLPLTWAGILLCLSQSAIFSGVNLALFSIARLNLELEARAGSEAAKRVLELRRDSNMALATILWGNVAINVLLTILADSVLAGATAFLFSTVLITVFGEIIPQAYFSRRAMAVASFLAPMLRFYQLVLWPVARPTAMALDGWLGPEGVQYFRESQLRQLIRQHIANPDSEVDRVEGLGAINFLAVDDISAYEVGEPVDPASVIALEIEGNQPKFPSFEHAPDDPFLQQVHASEKRWVILTDPGGEPKLVLDADGFLRAALLDSGVISPYRYCHRPLIATRGDTPLGELLHGFEARTTRTGDAIIDHDIILVWTDTPRIITGADVLGRLMRGIARKV
ncbi:MAG: DUF21 domain-containing protein [Myxococcales bacterium]|jgi:metal transporter CNNM|nr:MAG: DUF21 domain-containing protein [Myxococcales bacterium]